MKLDARLRPYYRGSRPRRGDPEKSVRARIAFSATKASVTEDQTPAGYFSFAYSALASFRMGMSGVGVSEGKEVLILRAGLRRVRRRERRRGQGQDGPTHRAESSPRYHGGPGILGTLWLLPCLGAIAGTSDPSHKPDREIPYKAVESELISSRAGWSSWIALVGSCRLIAMEARITGNQ
jgi:hypothetical protein